MGGYTKWLDSAAEEAVSESVKSSMNICSQIRKDEDNKKLPDHEKMESLQCCWQSMHKIMNTMENPKPKTSADPKKNIYSTSTGNFIVSAQPKINPDNYITTRL